jgi:RNA polymerase sigma-70 factor (ECF subfamily)
LPFEEATHQIAGTDDVEIEYLKRTYGSAFESAFREALASLSVPDRLLLKQRFQLGMTVAELGELHGVHASTVSRRVTEARERLAAATRQKMMDRLGLGAKEMSSVLRLIQSQIDISLTSVDGRDRRDLPG